MNTEPTVVEQFIVPHVAFTQAEMQLEQSFRYSDTKGEAEGVPIVGESGAGKTSVLKSFHDKHPAHRTGDGLEVPILFASVPSAPTVKSLAGAMLAALGVPDPDRGTENEKTRRLQVLIRETHTQMVMIDEFQHFVDQGTHKVMHHVADWLKVLIDSTQATLVVAGLPSCMAVIDQNPQLARRFCAPMFMPRFDWRVQADRRQFCAIVRAFHKPLSKRYLTPDLGAEDMAFRFYLASGGLIGFLAKLLRQVERNCASRNNLTITIEDLHAAHMQAIWYSQRNPDLPRPFDKGFKLGAMADELEAVGMIGTVPVGPVVSQRNVQVRKRARHVNDVLAAR
jgi:hypothetical protein